MGSVRKKMPYNGVLPSRLRDLLRNTTRAKVGEACNVQRQTVTNWSVGASDPNTTDLINLSRYFNVSVDYLLGISDVKKPDVTLRGVCEYLGLSERAVKAIALKYKPDGPKEMLNAALESGELMKLLYTVALFNDAANAYLYPPFHLVPDGDTQDYYDIAMKIEKELEERTQHTYYVANNSERCTQLKMRALDKFTALFEALTEAKAVDAKQDEEAKIIVVPLEWGD